MKDKDKKKEHLMEELTELRRQIALLEASEAAHRETQKALQESEGLYRVVIENIADAIAISVDTLRVFVNKGFLTMHGLLDPSEALGLPIEHFVVPEDKEIVKKRVQARLRGESVEGFVEYRIRRADGTIRTVQASATTITYKEQPAILAVLRDITPIKEAEMEILRLNTELQQRIQELKNTNDELETFNSTVSHDLRVPLTSIDGFSRKIVEKYSHGFDEKLTHYMSIIRNSIVKMQQLIDDLLAYSRLGRQAMHHASVSMERIVESVVHELRPIYPDGEVAVSPLPQSVGDAQMIHQVVTNLLSNAFKFTKYMHPRRIEIRGWTEANEQVYAVKDNGVGFDMEQRGKLFNAFQRLHPSEAFEGTGIGLAIVKRIVNLHGGKVWAEGKPNEGATFYFTLPKG